MNKPALHFTHANGIPSPSYGAFLAPLAGQFDIAAVATLGTDPRYPVAPGWDALVDQVIADIQRRFDGRPVIGLGHSFGALVTLMAAYRRPALFAQVVMMDPPWVSGAAGASLELVQALRLPLVDRLTPAGITLRRRDRWPTREAARAALRGNRLFGDFDPQCFEDFLACGVVDDPLDGSVTLAIPKAVEAQIFRTVPAWWWRRPRKPPALPVHLVTAEHSHFRAMGLPQRIARQYRIGCSVAPGSHMFPLERPEHTAALVARIIAAQEAVGVAAGVVA